MSPKIKFNKDIGLRIFSIFLFCNLAISWLLQPDESLSKTLSKFNGNFENKYLFIDNNTILPKSPHFIEIILSPELQKTLDAIIECESSWDPTKRNPISGAHGLCQFIPSTKKYVERKWKLKIDWDDPQEQLYACKRLLKEEGCRPWRASVNCHKCYE